MTCAWPQAAQLRTRTLSRLPAGVRHRHPAPARRSASNSYAWRADSACVRACGDVGLCAALLVEEGWFCLQVPVRHALRRRLPLEVCMVSRGAHACVQHTVCTGCTDKDPKLHGRLTEDTHWISEYRRVDPSRDARRRVCGSARQRARIPPAGFPACVIGAAFRRPW